MIYAMVIITFFLLALSAYFALVKEQEDLRKRVDDRLERLLRSGSVKNNEELSILRKEVMGQLSWFNRWLLDFRFANNLFQLVEQADLKIHVHHLVLLCFGIASFVGFVTWSFRGSVFAASLTAGVSCMIPMMIVSFKRRRRLDAFLEQLPDTLDLITRALRAGHALTGSLQTVAEEMPDPIAKEFRKTFEEQNLGIDLKSSLENLLRRIPLLDLRLCVTAIMIQRETGGNLAEILENIATVIRERFKILGQVKVYTAQGRMTGWVIGGIPFALALYMMAVNPDYIDPLFHHPTGKLMLYGGLTMQAIGFFVIRKIVNIKV